jgi:hypothetical protein
MRTIMARAKLAAPRTTGACSAPRRLPGESSGADKEVELAKPLGLAVYYELEDFLGGGA